MFNKEELMMIFQVFTQANFPGAQALKIGAFIQKVQGLIQQGEGSEVLIDNGKKDGSILKQNV